MELEKVKFRNFLCFGSREQEVVFQKGINCILGWDRQRDKSNGSGKSSLLETIPFALFGKTHKAIKKNSIINWKNNRKCVVKLYFKIGEDRYRVVRKIKPNDLEIFHNDELIPKPSNVREYQIMLENIIGFNYQMCMSLIHTNINSSTPILAMSKPEKRRFIEKIFGLEVYSAMNEKANKKIRKSMEKINAIDVEVKSCEGRIEEIENKTEKLKFKIRSIETSKEELNRAQEKLKRFDEDNKGISVQDIEEIESKIKESEEEIRNLNNILDRIRNRSNTFIKYKRAALLDVMFEITVNKGLLEEAEDDVKKKEEIEGKYGSIDDIAEKIDTLNKRYTENTQKYMEFDKKSMIVEGQISEAKNRLKEIKKFLKCVNEESICPTCGQSINKNQIDKIDEYEKEFEEKNLFINNSLHVMEKYRKVANDAQKKASKFNDGVESYRKVHRQLWNIQNRLSNLPKMDDGNEEEIQSKIDKYQRAENCLESTKSKLMKKLNAVSRKKEESDKKKKYLKSIEEERKEIESVISKLEMNAKSEKERRKELEEIVNDELKTKKKLQKEIVSLKSSRNLKYSVVDYMQVIKEICKDENIKQYAIRSLIPYLNSRVNHYLSEVGYGFYVVIDNWLDTQIKGPGIKNGTYENLSGGERRGIDLALQLAMFDIAKIQAGRWPDVIALDEVLDSSIDSDGIEKLLKILEVKQKEDKNKIFIISHRTEIGGDFEPDNIIKVVKNNDGFSRVHE